MAALKYWLWLTTRRGMDSVGALTVLDYFVTPERAYYADPEEYDQLPLRPAVREGLKDRSLDRAEAILGSCERLGLRIMTIQDGDYPDRLRQISDPPAVLYIRGRMFHFDEEVAIGVVGSREPSGYGQMAAGKLGMELAAGGALLVSGIAQGVDSLAIKGALKGGGSVVSVLAGGVDVPYPMKNRYLYEDVAAVGALISEYPPGTAHQGEHFPRRNRILSGLCLGVLAVECRASSGTMSTIHHALEQDRDIFAVPGPIDAHMSEGTNRLIQRGAKLVTCGQDILEEYVLRFPVKLAGHGPAEPEEVRPHPTSSRPWPAVERRGDPEPPAPAEPETAPMETLSKEQQKERLTDDELAVLLALTQGADSADEVVERSQVPARRVLSALTILQIQGLVEEQPGRRFRSRVLLEE